jgi:hypothetical protein
VAESRSEITSEGGGREKEMEGLQRYMRTLGGTDMFFTLIMVIVSRLGILNFTKLHTLRLNSLLSVNYISIKLFKRA